MTGDVAAPRTRGRGLNPCRASSFDGGMCRAGALLTFLSAAAAAAGQQPGSELTVVLRDQNMNAVVGAHGRIVQRPAFSYPALAEFHGLARPTDTVAARTLVATSDERGTMRFAPRTIDEAPGAGSGLVWNEAGLGALVSDLQPSRPQRLVLQPMASVTTSTGSEELEVFARAVLPSGRTVMPTLDRGHEVRLPAGAWELWVRRDDEWVWLRRAIAPGQRLEVTFAGKPHRVIAAPDTAMLRPDGRADVVFGAESVLWGDAASAPLVALRHGVVSGPWVIPPAASSPSTWPRGEQPAMVAVSATGANGRTTVFGVRRTDNGFRVFGAVPVAPTDADSATFAMAAPPPGDTWLLFVADDRAPRAIPWTGAPRVQPDSAAGVPFRVEVRDDNGDPCVDVALEYEPVGMAPAAVAGHTDGRGIARLGPVIGPGVLRVCDERYANASFDLDTVPVGALSVRVEPGHEVRGTAHWPDGAPVAGAVVTLRDAAGVLRPSQRAVVSGDDGSFVFTGLPANRPLVLFASIERDHRTWSTKIDRALAGRAPFALELRNEDPELGPRDDEHR